MVNKFYRKDKEKLAKGTTSFLNKKKKRKKESLIQVSKSFWRGKRKWRKHHRRRNKNPSGEEKEKKVEYMKNYYSAHEKYLLSWFVDFWGPGAIQNNFFMVAKSPDLWFFFLFWISETFWIFCLPQITLFPTPCIALCYFHYIFWCGCDIL